MAEERESQGLFRDGAALLQQAYAAVMSGGEVQAAVRQGFRELGNALGQIWPQGIAVTEPGSVFNPLHSDIAAGREALAPAAGWEALGNLPSPAMIGQNVEPLQPAAAVEHGHLPSPSEIGDAQGRSFSPPEPSREPQQGHER